MKFKVIVIILYIFLITGCTIKEERITNNEENGNRNILKVEAIEKEYEDEGNEILNIFEFKRNNSDYILVESQIPSLANRFELINLKSGDRDLLPNEDYFIESYKVINENYIVLVASGKHSENTLREVPFEMHFKRVSENANSNHDFIIEYKDIKFPIDSKLIVGGKEHEVIAIINTTLNGLQIMFESQEGYESIFNADIVAVPPTETDYDEYNNQFIIYFKNTKLSSLVKEVKRKNYSENYYYSSIEIREDFNNSSIIINLKEPTKFFCIETFALYSYNHKFNNPCLEIKFMGED